MAINYKALAPDSNFINITNGLSGEILVVKTITVANHIKAGDRLVIQMGHMDVGGGVYLENMSNANGGNISLPALQKIELELASTVDFKALVYNSETSTPGDQFCVGVRGFATAAPSDSHYACDYGTTLAIEFIYNGINWECLSLSPNQGYKGL